MNAQLEKLLMVTQDIQEALEKKNVRGYLALFEKRSSLFSGIDTTKKVDGEDKQLLRKILVLDEANKLLLKSLIIENAHIQIDLIHRKNSLKNYEKTNSFINVEV